MPTVTAHALSILVIDDNRDAANALASLLRLHGYEVAVGFDGGSALRSVQSNPPDIVVLDLALPDIDGLEVAARIRSQLSPAPVLVAVSGFCRPADKDRSRRAGFVAHLGKPFEVADLLRVLEAHAARRPAVAEGAADLVPQFFCS